MLNIQDLSQSIDAAFESYDPIDFYAAESTKKDSNKLYKQLNKEIREISKNAERAYKKKEYKECIRLCDEGIKITDRYLGMIPDLMATAKENGDLKKEGVATVVCAILRSVLSVALSLSTVGILKGAGKISGTGKGTDPLAKVTIGTTSVLTASTVVTNAYTIKTTIQAIKDGKSINFGYVGSQIKLVKEMFIELKNDAKAAMSANPAAEASSCIFVEGIDEFMNGGSALKELLNMGYDDTEACELYVSYFV